MNVRDFDTGRVLKRRNNMKIPVEWKETLKSLFIWDLIPQKIHILQIPLT